MAWFKVDDVLHSHPKAREAGLLAMGLWVQSGSHSAQYLTDGFVPEWFVKSWPNGVRAARQLVQARLWEEAVDDDGDKGWQFRDWGDYQPLRDEIESDREANRERQRRFRQARRDQRRAAQDKSTAKAIEAMRNGVTNNVTNGATNSPPYPTRTQPDPTRPLSSSNNLPNGGKLPKQRASENEAPEVQPCGNRHDAARPCGGCKRANERAAEAELKERMQAASTLGKVRARERQEAIDACDLCDETGRSPNGMPCHHVESAPMPEALRELIKTTKETTND